MKLIVANSINGVIGKDGKIPWEQPEDLKRFKKLTNNSYVIMGKNTYNSIGKPLKNRINLILSKTIEKVEGAFVFKSIDELTIWLSNQELAFPKIKKNVFVIGGEKIYKGFLDRGLITSIIQTVINKDYEGDSFFNFDKKGFYLLFEENEGETTFKIWTKDN